MALEPVDLHPGYPAKDLLPLLPVAKERTKRRRDTLYEVNFAMRHLANRLWLALQASARFDSMVDVERDLRELEKKVGDVLHGYADEDE